MIKIKRSPVPPPSLAVEKQKVNGIYNPVFDSYRNKKLL